MTEVREITRSALICASWVMSSSLMPSAKYSWSTSPERFSRGSTASDCTFGGCPFLEEVSRNCGLFITDARTKSKTTPERIKDKPPHDPRGCARNTGDSLTDRVV